jgi:C1A family cysteine protease
MKKAKAIRPKQSSNGSTRTYGWKPDVPDHRDLLYGSVRRTPAMLPEKVDLRPLCSRVEDQGNLNSCTGNALAGALEFLEKKAKLRCVNLSRLFIYYNERAMEHSVNADDGAYIRDGIKTLVKQGVCHESKWPYDESKWKIKPDASCYEQGMQHQVVSYARLHKVDEMRACLAEGFPFIFGFSVYEAFDSPDMAKTGVLSMPGPKERQSGGHAVLAVGYDDGEKRFIVRNSWGPKWGMKGYFTMPYEYLASRDLSDDFWTIRRGEQM